MYGGSYVVGCDYMFGYGQKANVPKNVHDLTKAKLSYSVVATNLRRMMPKSLVGSVIGFADQLQLSHFKLQQAIAKAKPDGLIVDIEGLENVQLGKGGELQPLIYKTSMNKLVYSTIEARTQKVVSRIHSSPFFGQ